MPRRSGLHPATLTGILDRLERGGWIERTRNPSDRRGVVVRPLAQRNGEVRRVYTGMDASVRNICAAYETAQLELIADFLTRVTAASQSATQRIIG